MKNLVLFVSLLFCFIIVSAQQLRFDRFDVSKGLSQNNVNCLETDAIGNIWIGTLDGVNVYNGYAFQHYQPSNIKSGQISGGDITVLGKGLEGNMWVVARGGGLNFYDASQNNFSVIDRNIFGQFNVELTSTITQLNDSIVCFTSHTLFGVWNLKSNSFDTHQLSSEIRGALKINENQLMLYGSFGVQKVTIENQSHFEILSSEDCFKLYAEPDGYYLIQNNGFIQTDKNIQSPKLIYEFTGSDLKQFNVSGVRAFAVNDNSFWIGGGGFLIRFHKAGENYELQKFENDPFNGYSFKGHTITHLLVDEVNNLWVGTFKNGLSHLNYLKNQFQHYSWEIESVTDPESNPVRAICKSKSGELWMGFDREGIGMLDTTGTFHHFTTYRTSDNKTRKIEYVRSIFEDSEGVVWIGENSNLCVFNKSKNRVESVDCRYRFRWNSRCYVIKEFEPGIVTIASSANVGFINKQEGTLSTLSLMNQSNPNGQSVRDIVQDKYRNLWLTKDNRGLLKITYPEMTIESVVAETHGLTDNKIYSLSVSNDSLWIGTNTGLNLFDIKRNRVVSSYFEADGLSNNIVYSVNRDNGGNLWMSTNRGISCFNVKANTFRTFLPEDFFMDDAHSVGPGGTFYYGGYTGVVSFKPSEIETNFKLSKPIIQSLFVENTEVYPDDTLNGKVILSKTLAQTHAIELSFKHNTFAVGFNGYPFDYPNTNRFRYRLNGLHSNWIESSSDRKASYTKVPPGNYTFQLQVASAHQDFSETRELHIHVIPPFWRTTWFKIALLISILAASFGVYRFRINQIQQRNIWLQRKVDEQTSALKEQNKTILEMSEQLHESDQSKLQFFTNVSHEFRTPLTIILGHIENLTVDSKRSIKTIRKNALLLLRLINQVIDLRKLDQNQLKLSVSEFEIVAFIEAIVDSFNALADNKKLQIVFNEKQPELMVWLDAEKTEMILYNLLSNAIKYSSEGKTIQVIIERAESDFVLKVIDEGIGVSAEERERIFERFYRAKDGQKHSGGHGIGLSLVKGLVEMQHGTIALDSEPGKGSCFSLTFKLGKDHFAINELGESNRELVGVEDVAENLSSFVNGFGDKKIMLVEDNPELVEFMVGLLEKHFALHTASNGKEALEAIEKFSPDLIISDIMMPVMDGMTFCRQVKNSIETSHIPFILLSAKTDVETQVDGFETGADAYIEKPFNSRLLFARIHSLLKNRENIKAQFMASDRKLTVENQLSATDRDFIKRVNTAIEVGISDPQFTIEVLSEKMNMSRATFYRKFSDLTGIKPADYIRRIRLKHAYEMLVNQNLTIAQISENVGFQSVSHFRKSFKDEFGKTPTEVRSE